MKRQAALLLLRQMSGEGGRTAEYKRLCALTGKVRILLRLLVNCEGSTKMQSPLSIQEQERRSDS